MTEFSTRQTIAHTPDQMFALVADIESYPQFVPLCDNLKIIERQKNANGHEVMIADMAMAYKLFKETFRSRVTLTPADDGGVANILVEYLDGPFSHLENRWHFHPLNGLEKGGDSGRGSGGDNVGTDVEFYIAYEFRQRHVQMMVGPVFDKVFRRFINAFEARADQLYA